MLNITLRLPYYLLRRVISQPAVLSSSACFTCYAPQSNWPLPNSPQSVSPPCAFAPLSCSAFSPWRFMVSLNLFPLVVPAFPQLFQVLCRIWSHWIADEPFDNTTNLGKPSYFSTKPLIAKNKCKPSCVYIDKYTVNFFADFPNSDS